MLLDHSREKLINASIFFAKHTDHCGMTKLMKLLAFFDFIHFKQTGRSVTSLVYLTWPKGPLAKEYHDEIKEQKTNISQFIGIMGSDDSKFQKIVPRKQFDKRYFTKRELKLLEKLSYLYKVTLADDIVEISHLKNKPWDLTIKTKGMYQEIDYLLAIDDEADSINKDEALRRIKEDIILKKEFR